MNARSKNLIDPLISFLDIFIHPKILNASSFILLRSRILIFWMLTFLAVVISAFRHLFPLVGPLHPMILTLEYCFLQVIAIVVALRIFGSYRVAFYIVMFSLYLNTPVVVIYSGGLHSPSLIFYLFMPLVLFQLTKFLLLPLIGFFIGFTEMLLIFYLHVSGWDYAGKGIIENYFPQLAGNILVTTIGIWIISLIYTNGLAQASLQISDANRFKAVMHLSNRMVHEFEKPLTELNRQHDLLHHSGMTYEKAQKCLDEINGIVFHLSSLVSSYRSDNEKVK